MLKSDDEDKLYKVSNKWLKETRIEGIPEHLRGEIWWFLCRAKVHMDDHRDGLYHELYQTKLKEDVKIAIDKDVPRTQSEIITKQQRTKLRNILYAYANYDENLGYTQGMNSIVFMLIYYVKDEEKAFWCFYDIMFHKSFRLMFHKNMPKLTKLI